VAGDQAKTKVVSVAVRTTTEINLPSAVRDVIVGSPDIADVIIRSPTQLFLAGKMVGSTNIFLLDAAGQIIDRFEVSVHPDSQAVLAALKDVLPNERISVDGAGDALVLSGTVSSDGVAKQAQLIARRFITDDNQLINVMRIGPEQQVMLKVTVAEVEKSALKELGINNLLSPTTIGDLVFTGMMSAAGGVLAAPTSGAAFMNGFGAITGAPSGAMFVDGPGAIDSAIRILEDHGLSRSLAEPNLVAVSGEYATMLAGGEVPIPVASDSATGSISVEYKPFGVSLSFLPIVLDKGRISLKIGTEVSSMSGETVSLGVDVAVPTFIVRRASSTVELPSGGSIMIAGLLRNDIISGLNGVPGLMNIPVLGALFRSTSFQQDESELVIVVRAILVQPTDPGVLSLPTDGFAPASDLDRYLLGHLQNIYTNRQGAAPAQVPQLEGPMGYIIR